MSGELSAAQIQTIQYGDYFCSPCHSAFKPYQVSKVTTDAGTYMNCPVCGQNIDFEPEEDEDDLY